MMKKHIAIACLLCIASAATLAEESVLNIYSARHYPTDEALYAGFTKATGIKLNRVDADDAGILARLKAEGSASPADIILLVDASRLWRGEIDGLFQPIKSKILDDAIPAQYRAKPTPTGETPWFGFSTRARVIVYDKARIKKEDVDTYEELGDPKNKGKLCIRSGSHPYNLSLFGAVTEHLGDAAAEQWLKGMVANMARSPKGGDTDQIKAVASGECAPRRPKTRPSWTALGWCSPTKRPGAHTSTSRAGPSPRMPRIRPMPSSSWSIWPAHRRKTILPTATTNGLPPRAYKFTTLRCRP
jgi:iron(III) transport system substrate-binding protein